MGIGIAEDVIGPAAAAADREFDALDILQCLDDVADARIGNQPAQRCDAKAPAARRAGRAAGTNASRSTPHGMSLTAPGLAPMPSSAKTSALDVAISRCRGADQRSFFVGALHRRIAGVGAAALGPSQAVKRLHHRDTERTRCGNRRFSDIQECA